MIALFGECVEFSFVAHRHRTDRIGQFDSHAQLLATRIGDFDRLANLAGVVGRDGRTVERMQFNVESLKGADELGNCGGGVRMSYFRHGRFEDEVGDRRVSGIGRSKLDG